MPYIASKEQRKRIDRYVNLLACIPNCDGDMNYTITTFILKTFQIPLMESYENYERIDGLLEKVKHEIRRRWADPYEDRKLKENGDII